MKTDGKNEDENRGMEGERQRGMGHRFNRGASSVNVHREVCVLWVFDGLGKRWPLLSQTRSTIPLSYNYFQVWLEKPIEIFCSRKSKNILKVRISYVALSYCYDGSRCSIKWVYGIQKNWKQWSINMYFYVYKHICGSTVFFEICSLPTEDDL